VAAAKPKKQRTATPRERKGVLSPGQPDQASLATPRNQRWPDAQRMVSTADLVNASLGWDQAYDNLARTEGGAEAKEALAVARILRATVLALLSSTGPRREHAEAFLKKQESEAEDYLTKNLVFALAGDEIAWEDTSGRVVIPPGDLTQEKGSTSRTLSLDALINTIEGDLRTPFEERDNPGLGIQSLILATLEHAGVLRQWGLPQLSGPERKKVLGRMQKAIGLARLNSSKPDAEKVLRAALQKKGLGANKEQVKALLAYRDRREERRVRKGGTG